MTPQEKEELKKKWTDKNNEMLWTTATESDEVADFWLNLLDQKIKEKLESVQKEMVKACWIEDAGNSVIRNVELSEIINKHKGE